MKSRNTHIIRFAVGVFIAWTIVGCANKETMDVKLYETSAAGNQLTEIPLSEHARVSQPIVLLPEEVHQSILGFGGAFTEASAYLLNQLSAEKRKQILHAYFSEAGANYSLTRTHINSCDFSLGNYSYAPVAGDTILAEFSIQEDMDDLIPMIKDAMAVSKDGFKLIASPWTAPPWMKDNTDWKGGKLLPEHYGTWSLFLNKYIAAYGEQGIGIWGITVENEPLGNANNWESMIFSPEEMNDLVKNHLGPSLRKNFPELKILGYDQNRDEELQRWADAMYNDAEAKQFFDGIAVHWYASTYDYFPDALQYAHQMAPDKVIIQTEACIDAEVPRWKDDAWYWSKSARDWGWTWAPADKKHLHPEYTPAFRYAGDIIGCLNNHVNGWVDWNMVLDHKGGPNWAKNWCIAPVIVNPETDEVYITPLYYVMAHFSKFIRPGAVRIGIQNPMPDVQATAAKNADGSIAVVLFNPNETAKEVSVSLNGMTSSFTISPKAIQTMVIQPRANQPMT
ncbi:MAG: glycoside hydrolase family 30 protein [Flavobacteriales bacterium]